MSTQALQRAIELVDDKPFDMSTYEMCAATALHRAVAEHPDGELGEAYEPAGEYADPIDRLAGAIPRCCGWA
jgi:hypothetical protein